jgi:hypothetical protein
MEKREAMTGDDLLWAMATLGFENYIEPLKLYLHKYREVRAYSIAFGWVNHANWLPARIGWGFSFSFSSVRVSELDYQMSRNVLMPVGDLGVHHRSSVLSMVAPMDCTKRVSLLCPPQSRIGIKQGSSWVGTWDATPNSK